MARQDIERLTARKVETLNKPGVYIDGEGLRLVVDATGGKRWRFRFRFDGKDRELGLGGYRARGGLPAVSLAMAREKARKAREHVRAGRNPLEQERGEVRIPTFGEAADAFIEAQSPSWRNPVHRAQWCMTLREYAAPIRDKRVDRIDTADVLRVLKPVWQSKPETAARLRGRIERVLSAAKAQGHRSGENPAAWRGHLDHLLPARQKLTRGHHAALAFADLPAFVATLREQDTVAALALEFVILTAARSGEVTRSRRSARLRLRAARTIGANGPHGATNTTPGKPSERRSSEQRRPTRKASGPPSTPWAPNPSRRFIRPGRWKTPPRKAWSRDGLTATDR